MSETTMIDRNLEPRARAAWSTSAAVNAEYGTWGAFWSAVQHIGFERATSGLVNQPTPAVSERAAAPEPSPVDTEASARATWSSNPAIRREFPEFRHYLAYTRATAAGLAKVYGRPATEAAPAKPARKPTLQQLLGPPERIPAPNPPPAAVAAFEELDGQIHAGLEAIERDHGVGIREFNWTPNAVEFKVKK